MERNKVKNETRTGLVSSTPWLKSTGRSRTTFWRWRKAGFIKTVTIAGRLYLTQEQIETFERRAATGELTRLHSSNATEEERNGCGNMPKHLAAARGLTTADSEDKSTTSKGQKEGC
jgi:hypothetical protein